MNPGPSTFNSVTPWEHTIRAREEEARTAFLAADVRALDELWSYDYAVNSPLQKVLQKPQVLELLRTGRIRHSAYEVEIEYMSRHGDVAVVMGRDSVVDPPDGTRSKRRFTNIWRLEGGVWRSIARHAHVVAQEAAGADPQR